jgi:DNA polymerase-4
MTRNPSLVGIPATVAGDPKKRTGIILAANYEARAYGVKTAIVLHARKIQRKASGIYRQQ